MPKYSRPYRFFSFQTPYAPVTLRSARPGGRGMRGFLPYSIKFGISGRILYVNGPGSFSLASPAAGAKGHNASEPDVSEAGERPQAGPQIGHRQGEAVQRPRAVRGRGVRPAGPPPAHVRPSRPRLRDPRGGRFPAQRDPPTHPRPAARIAAAAAAAARVPDRVSPLAPPRGGRRPRLVGRGPAEAGAVP